MDFENTLNYMVADLTAVHRTALEKQLKTVRIHSGQVFILFELWKKDDISQIDLSKNLNLSPPTINKLVKGLSEAGYVNLRRSSEDARIVNVSLTSKGSEIKRGIESIWMQLEENITQNLTQTEKLILFQLLEKILLNFYSVN